MKNLLAIILICFGVVSAQAETLVQITGTKQLGQKQRGDKQKIGSVSSRLSSRTVYYEFNVRSVSPKLKRVTAEWVLLVDTLGIVMPAAHGQRALDLKIGHSVFMKTDSVDLSELKLRHIPNIGSAEIEKKIQGFGIRLLDEAGQVVAEKYSSRKVETAARAMLVKLSRSENKEAPMTLDQLIQELIKTIKSKPGPPGPPTGFPPRPGA